MKRTALLIFTVLFALTFSIALADQTVLPLYSGATGTTVAVTGDTVYAPFIVGSAGCDIQSSPTVTVTVRFDACNAFRDTATFDTAGLATATTCTTGACNVQFTKTFRAMRAIVTAATSTAVVNVNCSVR